MKKRFDIGESDDVCSNVCIVYQGVQEDLIVVARVNTHIL